MCPLLIQILSRFYSTPNDCFHKFSTSRTMSAHTATLMLPWCTLLLTACFKARSFWTAGAPRCTSLLPWDVLSIWRFLCWYLVSACLYYSHSLHWQLPLSDSDTPLFSVCRVLIVAFLLGDSPRKSSSLTHAMPKDISKAPSGSHSTWVLLSPLADPHLWASSRKPQQSMPAIGQPSLLSPAPP